MSHPDPHAPPDRTPIQIGEVWENPMSGENVTLLELPHQNPEHRVVAELLARVGARVVGEHRHPALVERFTVLEGELTMKRGEQTSTLRQGETLDTWLRHSASCRSPAQAKMLEIGPQCRYRRRPKPPLLGQSEKHAATVAGMAKMSRKIGNSSGA
jgi:mannose-6-phosphate isomerase-like protein (cupin superfamily)